MPFVDSTKRDLFIGRREELGFFTHNILTPLKPTCNIILISGEGGVGKSTLLEKYKKETTRPQFQDYCRLASVDDVETSVVDIIEKFAEQLGIKNKLKRALNKYNDATNAHHQATSKRETIQKNLQEHAPGLVGDTITGIVPVPFMNAVVGKGAEMVTEKAIGKLNDGNAFNGGNSRDNSEKQRKLLGELTDAFVAELNTLAKRSVLTPVGTRREMRIILCFDTFEKLGSVATPWLEKYFLPRSIEKNIVLVIAGRGVVTSIALPTLSSLNITMIFDLKSFSLDETREYLEKQDITDKKRIANIHSLSQGLPFYLNLLTLEPHGKINLIENTVARLLRWIPEQEKTRRQLVIQAALFNGAFNQDDLRAFKNLPRSELSDLYDWLIKQSFVISNRSKSQDDDDDGRYIYDELARELLSRYFYQRSKVEYNETRAALVKYYQEQLEHFRSEVGEKMYRSNHWLELVIALLYQLFLLPDRANHMKAIEHTLDAYRHMNREQTRRVIEVLQELLEKQSLVQTQHIAQEAVKLLLDYIEADFDKKPQGFVAAANDLLKKAENEQSLSPHLIGIIHRKLGKMYGTWGDYHKAIYHFTCAIELNSKDKKSYNGRGRCYIELKEFSAAIKDFQRALEPHPDSAPAYDGLVGAYIALNDYSQAIADFDERARVKPKSPLVFHGRGWIQWHFGQYQEALTDFNRALKLNPKYIAAYYGLGRTYLSLGQYQRAIDKFSQAILLDPNYAPAYSYRGLAHLHSRNLEPARDDFAHSWNINSARLFDGLMTLWTDICRGAFDPGKSELLERIATVNLESYMATICQAIALWMQRNFKPALEKLARTAPLSPIMWDIYFWKGMILASLDEGEQSQRAIDGALKRGLPPILLLPLYWFKSDRPGFYEKYAAPLLKSYGLLPPIS